MDIAAWLQRLDLGQYEEAFHEHAIDAEILPSLTGEDLEKLGVTRVGHRRKLLDAIATLRGDSPANNMAGLYGKVAPATSAATQVSERRQVAVLFADLTGYTRLSAEIDAEEVHALLGAFFEAADGIVAEHGGLVDKHIGDSVMAVFGAPVAHGNDAERAARAALSIRGAMPALPTGLARPIGVHIGIASGEVVASDVGSAEHRAYTVIGESVNLASRLTAAAEPGEILVSTPIHDALADRMEFAGSTRLSVKGIASPVRAWRLAAVKPTVTPSTLRPLVGREHELRLFSSALSACLESGRGQTVYVRGEAGIGKTRLVDEFRRAATEAGFLCHSAITLDFGAGAGRDAVGLLARSLLGMPPGGSDEETRERIGAACGAQTGEPERAVYLYDLLALAPPPGLRALADAMDNATRVRGARQTLQLLVERASAVCPLLLIVEDLHWANGATLESLGAAASATGLGRALLVITTRVEGDPLGRGWQIDWPLLRMDLAPLRDEEAHALAMTLLDSGAAGFAARCVERGGGNPLFIEQLARLATERSEIDAVPDTVQSLVQARLDRLEPPLKQALQAATVFGQRFSIAGLQHVLGKLPHDLDALVAHHLVRSDGADLLFAHALIRDAVYATLLHSRRRDLHRRAAAWFAERGDHSLRAEHLDSAEDPHAASAHMEAAAAQVRLYRNEAALDHIERGLALVRDPELRFALSCRRGDLLHDLGRTAEALSAYETALATAQSDEERCRVWLGLAAVKRIADDLDGALVDLALAEVVASRLGLSAEAARVHFLRGSLLFPRGEIERCLAEHQASLERAREAGSAELEAMALGGLGDAEYLRGNMLSAHARFRDCVALSRRHGFGRIEVANRPMMAFTRMMAGDTRGALQDAEEAIAAARRVGHLRAEMIGHHGAWFCQYHLAHLDAAHVHADAALALSQRLGARRFDAEALAFRAELYRREGHNCEALIVAKEAVQITRDTGVAYFGPLTLGILALATEDRTVREELFAAAEAILEGGAVSHNHLIFRRDAIEGCLDARDWAGAERHASALEAYARWEPSPWSTFFVDRGRALAAVGRGDLNTALRQKLSRLRDDAERFGYLIARPSIEAALAIL